VWNRIKYTTKVEKEYGEIPEIKGSNTKLLQVFTNLLTNAQDAIEECRKDGRISIRTYRSERGVCVEISDNGTGIPEENCKKIFDPFFTTKPPGKGTGLGLYITYGIIKEHNADIRVVSKVGEGSKFILEFPFNIEKNVEVDKGVFKGN